MGLSLIVGTLSAIPAIATCVLYLHGSAPTHYLAVGSWVSLAGLAVATAAHASYASHSTWLLGKDPKEGRVPLWSWLAWWPYHMGLRVKLWVARSVLLSEPLYNRVLPGWYLGGWPSSASHLPPGRLSVLDVTCELPRTHGARYLCLPVWDTRVPSMQQMDTGVEWALREHARTGAVYIHCAHGHGRSATLMAACFLQAGLASSVDHAVSLMTAARPAVKLSARQRAGLERWAAARALPRSPTQLDSSSPAPQSHYLSHCSTGVECVRQDVGSDKLMPGHASVGLAAAAGQGLGTAGSGQAGGGGVRAAWPSSIHISVTATSRHTHTQQEGGGGSGQGAGGTAAGVLGVGDGGSGQA